MSARIEVYTEAVRWDDIEQQRTRYAHKWRWRFISNGRVMADSGQGYSRRIDCVEGAARVLGGMEMGPAIYRRELHMRQDEGDEQASMKTDSLWIPVVDLTREATS